MHTFFIIFSFLSFLLNKREFGKGLLFQINFTSI